jgi:hypothetical protein
MGVALPKIFFERGPASRSDFMIYPVQVLLNRAFGQSQHIPYLLVTQPARGHTRDLVFFFRKAERNTGALVRFPSIPEAFRQSLYSFDA